MKPIYIGVVYNHYTPQVEAQLTRDLIHVLNLHSMRGRDCVVVSQDGRLDPVIQSLGCRRAYLPKLPKTWFQYRTKEDWPELVPEARPGGTVIQRDLYVPVKEGNLQEAEQGAYYLPPQGRISPDVISLLRPAPNGFAYPDPMISFIWS